MKALCGTDVREPSALGVYVFCPCHCHCIFISAGIYLVYMHNTEGCSHPVLLAR